MASPTSTGIGGMRIAVGVSTFVLKRSVQLAAIVLRTSVIVLLPRTSGTTMRTPPHPPFTPGQLTAKFSSGTPVALGSRQPTSFWYDTG